MAVNMSGSYRIRPAGRHILTIGRDLIQDSYAAVVELVKNAYDADSPDVCIDFSAKTDQTYTITISDHGHGMSRDDVAGKWMVPSTRYKLDQNKSPSGRTMQGRKGIGRYAASLLGEDLLLETVTSGGKKTTVLVEWQAFEAAQYLDDVEILIETSDVNEASGTRLIISGSRKLISEWDQKQFNKLRFELKKLVPPVSISSNDQQTADDFRIHMKIRGFPKVQDIDETIEPYPIFELFDYRIMGRIHADGRGVLEYGLQKARNTTEEKIPFDNDGPTGCGDLVFDIRVYDREKEAIESLIARGLKDESGNYVGKLEARQLLNEYNGIGVYRNGFRIRPLGDAEFDWLKLNEQRVQNPSLRIGSNQVIGYVEIQSEKLSGLIEKSARDGLRENDAFTKLKKITQDVITLLESRRFEFRQKAGLGRPVSKIEREFEKMFAYDGLKKNVKSTLTKGGVNTETINTVTDIINRDAENRNKIVDEIRQAVAIYQGQATLGKIINVILHEGRRPLNFFRNQIPNLQYWYKLFRETGERNTLEKSMPIVEGVGSNAEVFVKLFSRLDPLAAGKRSARKQLLLKDTILGSLSVFEEEMKAQNITVSVNGSDNFELSAWQQDIYAIFTNLVDNSMYWMNEKSTSDKNIIIDLVTDDNSLLHIDYRDTGPGIEQFLIDSEVIFEPQFSTKPSGTGLGLAIAGEAAMRNGMELKALESEQGVWFRLQPIMEND